MLILKVIKVLVSVEIIQRYSSGFLYTYLYNKLSSTGVETLPVVLVDLIVAVVIEFVLVVMFRVIIVKVSVIVVVVVI